MQKVKKMFRDFSGPNLLMSARCKTMPIQLLPWASAENFPGWQRRHFVILLRLLTIQSKWTIKNA